MAYLGRALIAVLASLSFAVIGLMDIWHGYYPIFTFTLSAFFLTLSLMYEGLNYLNRISMASIASATELILIRHRGSPHYKPQRKVNKKRSKK